MDENDERVFMIRGEDNLGDQHIFVTTHRERAFSAYADFLKRYRQVKTNDAFLYCFIESGDQSN